MEKTNIMKRSFLLPLLCLFSYNAIALNKEDKLTNSIRENDLFVTKILQNDNRQYFVEVSTKDIIVKDLDLFGERFSYVYSRDCHIGNIEGYPALPIYTQCVALPSNCNRLRSAVVEALEWDTIKVGRLMPQQPSLLEGEVAKELIINREIYEGGWYQPNLIHTTDIQIFRGIKNTNVSVCPFKYNAVTGELAVMRSFRLKVTFAQDKANAKGSADPSRYHSLFDNVAPPSDLLSSSMRSNVGDYDYLIIVGDIPNVLNSDILKEFRMWKALRGIRAKVVTTDSTGCTDTSIKTYIHNQYASDSIKYVLFIGKTHHIPQHITHQYTHIDSLLRSDYWYGCMDGANDLEADIAIGRYPVDNLQELENAMRKTIRYEIGTHADGKKVLLVAHGENALQLDSYQYCLESISTNSNYSNFSFIKEYGATVAAGGTGANSLSVRERINQGVGIFNYRGHAGPFEWRRDWCDPQDPHFDTLMVSTFTNEKYPIALSIACETGRMDSTGTCLMESYMNGVHGIASGLGSTLSTSKMFNNKYNKYLYAIINSENDGLGFINIYAHKKYVSKTYPQAEDVMFSYCCFGDPSIMVWTDSIKQFPLPTIEILSGSISITVGSITDYDIVVASESDGLIAKYHSTSSNYSIPLPSVSCTIAIHKRNYQSYLFDYIATNYVQNNTVKRRTFTSVSPLAIGNNVTLEIPIGDVVIESGGVLQIKQHSEVTIPNGFECKQGGQLIIN